MRWLSRRVRERDTGAVAVVVAILAVVLFGFGALVIDVSGLWAERRQLQNGADAGSLAVAQLCAAGSCAGYTDEAKTYADDNSLDGFSNVEDVCGSTSAVALGLPACADQTDLPGEGWVHVLTRTGDDTSPGVVPPVLAKVLVPDYDGKTVHADAYANWGAPASLQSGLPLTFSLCEWEAATADGYAPPPPYTSTWLQTDGPSYERTIYFHDTTAAGSCPAGPSGFDLSGGFGWLQPDPDQCSATSTVDGWFDDKTGVAVPQDCSKDDLHALVGHVIFVPVYGATNGETGTNLQYQVTGFAAFYLTGYRFAGNNQKSMVTGNSLCDANQSCLGGFFTEGLVNNSGASGGVVGDGPSYGANVVGLAQ